MAIAFSQLTLMAKENKPTNKHFWASSTTTSSPEKIWNIWMDVANWKAWDDGLKSAQTEGPLKKGATGTITSLEGRISQFEVTEYTERESYTFRTKLPLAYLYVKRYLTEKDGRTTFTHEVWFKGFNARLFAALFGKKFRAVLPTVLEKIKKIAEK